VVKPARSGSAQGVSIVKNQAELNRAMIDAYVYCDVAIIEKYIEGTELAVSVVDLGAGPIALPPVEIEPRDGKYGYDERYIAGETNFYLRHISRIDVIVDKKGVVWFLEANVAPGLTETSLLPQSIAASGNSLGEVYYSLAEAAKRNV
jgi:D-alanine-D-alanine ligase